MDPVSLLVLLASAALGAGSVASEVEARKTMNLPILIRTVWKSDGDASLEAVELLSEGALQDVGILFDLDLLSWQTMLKSGLYRAFVLADLTGGEGRHVIFRAMKAGTAWNLDVAYTQGQGKAPDDQVANVEIVLTALSSPASMPVIPGEVEDLPSGRAADGRVPRQIPEQFTPAPVPEPAGVEAMGRMRRAQTTPRRSLFGFQF